MSKDIVKRVNSEFEIQAKLWRVLVDLLESDKLHVRGEVRLLTRDKVKWSGNKRTRKGKGMTKRLLAKLDLAIGDSRGIICAIEVKRNTRSSLSGRNKQRNKYLKLGVPEVFFCVGKKDIDRVVKSVLSYLDSEPQDRL